MSQATQDRPSNGTGHPLGPHPSFIQVAKPYIFEQKLQECMSTLGMTEAKEDLVRLQGVTWIDNVRKALQLPVRTYNTAVVYYHKFRLVHPEGSYDFREAAAAALFAACKIEDTLKKSRDILCAAHNMKLPAAEHLSPDDSTFEATSRNIVLLERLMLEASGFDFRNRYPQKLLIKLVKSCNLPKDTVGLTAYNVSLDLYRTFAPLKQTTQTLALACFELAVRLCDVDLGTITAEHGFDYERWATTREEIMETLVDLLDLYTHHRSATIVGPNYTLDKFIAVRITLNQEATALELPRYTNWKEQNTTKSGETPTKKTNGTTKEPPSNSPQSPTQVSLSERGKEGTVRFMLDPGRAREEKAVVKEYFRTDEVEEWQYVSEDCDEEACSAQVLWRRPSEPAQRETSPLGRFNRQGTSLPRQFEKIQIRIPPPLVEISKRNVLDESTPKPKRGHSAHRAELNDTQPPTAIESPTRKRFYAKEDRMDYISSRSHHREDRATQKRQRVSRWQAQSPRDPLESRISRTYHSTKVPTSSENAPPSYAKTSNSGSPSSGRLSSPLPRRPNRPRRGSFLSHDRFRPSTPPPSSPPRSHAEMQSSHGTATSTHSVSREGDPRKRREMMDANDIQIVGMRERRDSASSTPRGRPSALPARKRDTWIRGESSDRRYEDDWEDEYQTRGRRYYERRDGRSRSRSRHRRASSRDSDWDYDYRDRRR